MFAVRHLDIWLSWEEVCFYAAAFDLQTVSVLGHDTLLQDESAFKNKVLTFTQQRSGFESIDVLTQQPCTIEGVVSRNAAAFQVNTLGTNVFKYVRKGHVKTDEHWTRNWKRAPLIYELKTNKNEMDKD